MTHSGSYDPLPSVEFLHARPQAVSDIFDGHPGAHTLGPSLLVRPGMARHRRGAMARATRRVAGALDRSCARRGGCSARSVARPVAPPSGVWPLGAGGRQTLVDCVVSRISGGDGGGRPRMALTGCNGAAAGGAVGACRAGSAHRLPLCRVSGGRVAFPGGGVWRHGGTAALSCCPRGGADHGFTSKPGWAAHRASERSPYWG